MTTTITFDQFWAIVRAIGSERHPASTWSEPTATYSYTLKFTGRAGGLEMRASRNPQQVSIDYYLNNDERRYEAIRQHLSDLNSLLPGLTTHQDGNGYQLRMKHDGDFTDPEQQARLARWLVDTAARMERVIGKHDPA